MQKTSNLCPEIAKRPGEAQARRARLDSGTEAATEEQVEVRVEDDGGRPVVDLVQTDSKQQVTLAVTPVPGGRGG